MDLLLEALERTDPHIQLHLVIMGRCLSATLSSELQELILEVDNSLANFDTQQSGKALASFIDTLSNWYVVNFKCHK